MRLVVCEVRKIFNDVVYFRVSARNSSRMILCVSALQIYINIYNNIQVLKQTNVFYFILCKHLQ
jgi:hypothetical protein